MEDLGDDLREREREPVVEDGLGMKARYVKWAFLLLALGLVGIAVQAGTLALTEQP